MIINKCGSYSYFYYKTLVLLFSISKEFNLYIFLYPIPNGFLSSLQFFPISL